MPTRSHHELPSSTPHYTGYRGDEYFFLNPDMMTSRDVKIVFCEKCGQGLLGDNHLVQEQALLCWPEFLDRIIDGA